VRTAFDLAAARTETTPWSPSTGWPTRACSRWQRPTRGHLLIVAARLACPEVQWSCRTSPLDGGLAGPGVAGAHDRHRVRGPGRVLCDIGSYTRLVDRGWAIYRYTKLDVHGERDGSSRS